MSLTALVLGVGTITGLHVDRIRESQYRITFNCGTSIAAPVEAWIYSGKREVAYIKPGVNGNQFCAYNQPVQIWIPPRKKPRRHKPIGRAIVKSATSCKWIPDRPGVGECEEGSSPTVKIDPGPKDMCLHSNDKEMIWRECK